MQTATFNRVWPGNRWGCYKVRCGWSRLRTYLTDRAKEETVRRHLECERIEERRRSGASRAGLTPTLALGPAPDTLVREIWFLGIGILDHPSTCSLRYRPYCPSRRLRLGASLSPSRFRANTQVRFLLFLPTPRPCLHSASLSFISHDQHSYQESPIHPCLTVPTLRNVCDSLCRNRLVFLLFSPSFLPHCTGVGVHHYNWHIVAASVRVRAFIQTSCAQSERELPISLFGDSSET